MPYPLPDGGPPYSTDLRWFLVAVPDEAAFVQAALGAYTEFTHYWKWGKEGKEPGRNEAAQVWEDAVGATLEALEMGFPDVLLGYIDGVEALLQTLIDSQCCTSGTQTFSNDVWNIVLSGDDEAVPTSDYDTTSRPPDYATDATGATSFTAELLEDYLCAQAHLIWNTLDDMLEYGQRFENWLNTASNWLHHLGSNLLRYLYGVSGFGDTVLFTLEELAAYNDAVAAEVTSQAWQAARVEWALAKEDVICALAGQPNAADWKDALTTLVNSAVTSAAIKAIMLGGIPAALFSLIWNGLMKPDRWAGEGCDCNPVSSGTFEHVQTTLYNPHNSGGTMSGDFQIDASGSNGTYAVEAAGAHYSFRLEDCPNDPWAQINVEVDYELTGSARINGASGTLSVYVASNIDSNCNIISAVGTARDNDVIQVMANGVDYNINATGTLSFAISGTNVLTSNYTVYWYANGISLWDLSLRITGLRLVES